MVISVLKQNLFLWFPLILTFQADVTKRFDVTFLLFCFCPCVLCLLPSTRCRCGSRRACSCCLLGADLTRKRLELQPPVTVTKRHGLEELLGPLQTDRRRPVPVLRDGRRVSQHSVAGGRAAGPGQRPREPRWEELASVSMKDSQIQLNGLNKMASCC